MSPKRKGCQRKADFNTYSTQKGVRHEQRYTGSKKNKHLTLIPCH
jgi:hypothetical protein